MGSGVFARDLALPDYLDVVWAHMLSNSGAFTSPYEYREVMMAVAGWSDKTVEEVQAEQEARTKERDAKAKAKSSGKGHPAVGKAPTKSELTKFEELAALAAANRARVAAETPPPKPKRAPRKPRAPKPTG